MILELCSLHLILNSANGHNDLNSHRQKVQKITHERNEQKSAKMHTKFCINLVSFKGQQSSQFDTYYVKIHHPVIVSEQKIISLSYF